MDPQPAHAVALPCRRSIDLTSTHILIMAVRTVLQRRGNEDNKKGKNELVHHAASVGRSVEAVRLRSKKQEGWRIGGMKGR